MQPRTGNQEAGGDDDSRNPTPEGAEEMEGLDITGMSTRHPGEGTISSAPGEDFFERAHEGLARLEREFRAREADLAAREEAMAEGQAAFQGVILEARTQRQDEEAVLTMKARELARLREETAMEVTELDSYRAKLKATESRIDTTTAELAAREASSDDAATRLCTILVAVLAREKRTTAQLAWLEGIHSSQVEELREIHRADLAA